ncbi:MAG TPA: dihydroxyacetone kinase subunit DhaK, partial [Methylotenera sp.]|nr:dihydroxyacetone kinase subunit DhaK [Methylotenera sp.]
MKKFINKVDDILVESLSGFATAHADLVALNLNPNFLTRKNKAHNKVAIISGGGSGHEPLHAGYIGVGMLDAACPGHVFTSPTPDQMLEAATAVHADKGILLIVKNYAGDVMNFEMAAEMLPFENATVLTSDDCAVINSTYTTGRRGVAGTVIVEKCVGSLAETGADLAACKALGDKVNTRTASIGV